MKPGIREIETDILIIGGGMAGCMAAIKAGETGLSVTMVEKGAVARSGCTPWASSLAVFNPDWGHDKKSWMDDLAGRGEYLNNRAWTEIVIDESYDCYRELASWGVRFSKTLTGRLRNMKEPGSIAAALNIYDFAPVLRKRVRSAGVEVVERVMITDLIKHDGGIVAAVGITREEDQMIVIKAKATILAAGAGSFKPAGFPISSLTADGDAMAYRAGARITGKEFPDAHFTRAKNPAHGKFEDLMKPFPRFFPRNSVPPGRMLEYNALGEDLGWNGITLGRELEVHQGKAPLYIRLPPYLNKVRIVGGASAGLAVHKAEGIWPVDTDCGTDLPGLFAAGDALGSMQCGARYPGFGHSFAGSAVQGVRAGQSATAFARQADITVKIDEQLDHLVETICAPRKRSGGFTPAWVTQLLQNTMIPYFVLYVKEEKRLKAALTNVEFYRDHLVPKLKARDAHELRLVHETRNMVLNAEMKLRASLFRTESRGNHFSEDCPARNDEQWLAWITMREDEGGMLLEKQNIPDDWKPDQAVDYQDRYPLRFPGEMEYLSKQDGCEGS